MADSPAKSNAEKSVLDIVLTVYRQVLDDPSVSPDDDFFELGGDSFQAMEIMAMLEEATGQQIRAGAVFAFPTATELAGAIGITATPVARRVTRWGGGLPQYNVGHLDRVAAIRAAVAGRPGLAVAGAAYDGVGIPACVSTAKSAADQVLAYLARPQGT